MNATLFWELIDASKATAGDDDVLQEQLLIAALTELEPEQMAEFECLLTQYLLEADDFGIMAAEKIIDDYVSDDSYLYFRCWLVGQGEEVYRNALRNPDTLADVVEARFPEFEMLLGVANEAFELRTGKTEADEAYPANIAFARGLNYDGPHATTGTDWTHEQLPTLYPRLWAKFGGYKLGRGL